MQTEYPGHEQKRACMRCIWWLARNSVVGQCRRMPPARPDGEAAGFWPMTGRADWCGEYREGEPACAN
mgnify:FL=1